MAEVFSFQTAAGNVHARFSHCPTAPNATLHWCEYEGPQRADDKNGRGIRLETIYVRGVGMNRVIYLIGLIVVVLFVLGYLGIR